MNCTEEFIAKMKQKDIVINFVQAWRNDTLEESYARLDKPTRLHAYSVSKSVTSIGVGLAVQEGLLPEGVETVPAVEIPRACTEPAPHDRARPADDGLRLQG